MEAMKHLIDIHWCQFAASLCAVTGISKNHTFLGSVSASWLLHISEMIPPLPLDQPWIVMDKTTFCRERHTLGHSTSSPVVEPTRPWNIDLLATRSCGTECACCPLILSRASSPEWTSHDLCESFERAYSKTTCLNQRFPSKALRCFNLP